MLTYEENKHRIKYPCVVQPKLDGVYCEVVREDGELVLYSKGGNKFTGLDHINKIGGIRHDWDKLRAELYCHEMTHSEIVSAVSTKKGTHPSKKHIMLHIFEIVVYGFPMLPGMDNLTPNAVTTVDAYLAFSEDEVDYYYEKQLSAGYEGVVVRSPENTLVLKRKQVQDSEFKVVGYKEGKGKAKGTPTFECQVPGSEATFWVVPKVKLEEKKRLWEVRDSLIGKMYTVEYDYLLPSGKPRFPRGKGIRDYE